MTYTTNGHTFILHTDLRESKPHRLSFDALAQQIFGISFESWHRTGYWTDAYQPYTLFDGAQAVANVSINHMYTTWQGKNRHYIQLGTIMTHPDYRCMGLADCLLRRVLADWESRCDALYLYANDSVLGFYPPYGFVAAKEHQATLQVSSLKNSCMRLDISRPTHLAMLRRSYRRTNPYAELPMLNNFGLLMFYCGSALQDCIYYIEGLDALAIAERQGEGLLVYDVYGDGRATVQEVLGALVHATGATYVRLGFAWADAPASSLAPLRQEDSTLFVMDGMENVFAEHQTMFPLLSHA